MGVWDASKSVSEVTNITWAGGIEPVVRFEVEHKRWKPQRHLNMKASDLRRSGGRKPLWR